MRVIRGACAALGLFALPAAAADWGYLEPVEESRYTVNLNGGAGGYFGDLGRVTGVGPTWGLNVGGDATRGIGFEVAYGGARTPIDDKFLGGNDGEAVWRHGVSGLAKLYVPPMETVKPFAGIGLGAVWINPSDGAEPTFHNDYLTEIPIAAGVEYHPNPSLSAGLRATWSLQAGEEFARGVLTPGENAEGNMFSGALTVGGRF